MSRGTGVRLEEIPQDLTDIAPFRVGPLVNATMQLGRHANRDARRVPIRAGVQRRPAWSVVPFREVNAALEFVGEGVL